MAAVFADSADTHLPSAVTTILTGFRAAQVDPSRHRPHAPVLPVRGRADGTTMNRPERHEAQQGLVATALAIHPVAFVCRVVSRETSRMETWSETWKTARSESSATTWTARSRSLNCSPTTGSSA